MNISAIVCNLAHIVFIFIATMFSGFWWLNKSPDSFMVEIFRATFVLLVLYAYIFESGYKNIVINNKGARQQFYLIFLMPGVVASIGYIYGLLQSVFAK